MEPTEKISGLDALKKIDQALRRDFDSNKRILTYDEYLQLLSERPKEQARSSAQYLVDLFDYYGSTVIATGSGPPTPTGSTRRFHLFNEPIDGVTQKLVGHEEVQSHIYRTLRTFIKQGINDKLILLHGPNGSAKSTLIRAIMGAMERYSHLTEGAVYTFNWVFPLERYTKGSLGLQTHPTSKDPIHSFAKFPDEELSARIPCDLKDHPLLLVPSEQRLSLLEGLIGTTQARELWEHMPIYLTQGDLCHRCKQIFDSLLTANGGEYRRVLMHIQVERFFYSRRYRKGMVTVEPQLHVDAKQEQITMNKSIAALPVSLQGLNLFTMRGDLIDGNRGLIEYSDLLKRPLDSFKYLLGACETGSVNVDSSIAALDTVMLGSTNELQLDGFKEFPDFSSFKARMELIRVPYLLALTEEKEIYVRILPKLVSEKHIAPHVALILALWAILTRLKKPNSINYPPNISSLISSLTPLDKARLYDNGEMPSKLSPEDRKLLRSCLDRLKAEYANIPYYEGRMGASVREIKEILFDAVHDSDFPCLSPLAVFTAMESFVKRVSEYEFLKQDVKDGYHDSVDFIKIARNEYINQIDREVRDAIGLYDQAQWEGFLKRYVQHISILLKQEKLKNPVTGKLEDPDRSLINEFETIVEAPKSKGELDAFRRNIISQVGAWSLDHPNEVMIYAKVFPQYWDRLEAHYFETQKALLTKMHDAVLVYDTGAVDPNSEGGKLAQQTILNMKKNLNYCERCSKEVITLLMRQKY